MTKPLFLIFATITLFIAPFLISPTYLVHRNNDLSRNYIPIFSFFKESVTRYHQIPYWRPDQMMGENLIANPISSLYYPGNLLFVILPINAASILYLWLHLLLAGLSTFFLARSLKLKILSSTAAAIFYALSIKIISHLSAGHITMVAGFCYFPLVVLAIRKVLTEKKSKFKWIVLAATSLTLMFFLYPTVFYYAGFYILVYTIYKVRTNIIGYLPIIFTILVAASLSSIVLLPQLEFAKESTRSDLKLEDIAIPVWNFKKFVSSLIFPYPTLINLDHESLLYFGITPTILAAIGFYFLSKVQKLIVAVFSILSLAFALGTSTPLFKIAYDFLPLINYSRVTTRFWFILALVVALLAAFALQKINKKKLTLMALLIFFIEATYLSYYQIKRTDYLNFENSALYEYLANDQEIFRVYCTTYCFNPIQLSQNRIQLLNGENPIQQKSFVAFLGKAGNYNWDNFAVIFPPYQVWQTYNPPIPNAQLLGEANVKYVASTYEIIDPNFIYIQKYSDIYLYRNKQFKKRAFFENSNDNVVIDDTSPNRINLKFTPSQSQRKIIYSENYDKAWQPNVEKVGDTLRKITVNANNNEVQLNFKSKTADAGLVITLLTIITLGLWYFKKAKLK